MRQSFISMFIGAELTRCVFVAANLFFVPKNDWWHAPSECSVIRVILNILHVKSCHWQIRVGNLNCSSSFLAINMLYYYNKILRPVGGVCLFYLVSLKINIWDVINCLSIQCMQYRNCLQTCYILGTFMKNGNRFLFNILRK